MSLVLMTKLRKGSHSCEIPLVRAVAVGVAGGRSASCVGGV